MKRRLVLLAPLALALIPRRTLAHSFTLGPIEIGHPWAKPTVTEAAAMFGFVLAGEQEEQLDGCEQRNRQHGVADQAGFPVARQRLVVERDGGWWASWGAQRPELVSGPWFTGPWRSVAAAMHELTRPRQQTLEL